MKKNKSAKFRFASPDPLWEKYFSWSPYHYCMYNPVSTVDVMVIFTMRAWSINHRFGVYSQMAKLKCGIRKIKRN